MDYSELYAQASEIMSGGAGGGSAGDGPAGERLQKLCELLRSGVAHYNWFGFYIAERGKPELFLGPFAGEPTEHTRIPFGVGICGQAAANREAFLVPDVSEASNYLACSIKVKSEIVIPVFAPGSFDYDRGTGKGEVIGEIDIDSHTAKAFSEEDGDFLESLAILVAPAVEALRG